MEPQPQLTQTHKLLLTPQLRQYLYLLQLPVYELEQKIEEELTQNPVLEEVQPPVTEKIVPDPEGPDETSRKEESPPDLVQFMESFDGAMDDESLPPDLSRTDPLEVQKKRDYQESILTKAPTLANHLESQLGVLDLTPAQETIAREIIGNINDDGRLVASAEELASATQAPMDQVEEVLRHVQSLDPPGVGARNLEETLLIQLRRLPGDTALAQTIVEKHFDLLKRKQFEQIARALKTSVQRIKAAYEHIAHLEPKPGRIFYDEKPNPIIPDAKVSLDTQSEDELMIEINEEPIPQLRINPKYRQFLRQKSLDSKTKIFLRQKIRSGLELIRAIAQRKSTIRLITEELVYIQRDFFTKGFSHLKPLRLKDVADKIGIHESTVSRAVQSKYLDTPQGVVPYKSFFSTKLRSEDGTSESQKSATERLKLLVANEDKRKPLSDAKLVQLLEGEGVRIARRTVAKYRDLLKILPAHLRKKR